MIFTFLIIIIIIITIIIIILCPLAIVSEGTLERGPTAPETRKRFLELIRRGVDDSDAKAIRNAYVISREGIGGDPVGIDTCACGSEKLLVCGGEKEENAFLFLLLATARNLTATAAAAIVTLDAVDSKEATGGKGEQRVEEVKPEGGRGLEADIDVFVERLPKVMRRKYEETLNGVAVGSPAVSPSASPTSSSTALRRSKSKPGKGRNGGASASTGGGVRRARSATGRNRRGDKAGGGGGVKDWLRQKRMEAKKQQRQQLQSGEEKADVLIVEKTMRPKTIDGNEVPSKKGGKESKNDKLGHTATINDDG
eukprot:jgi/Bigna1/74677/fgenesh1_pg.30_\